VVKQSAQEIVDAVQALPESTRILVLSPVVRGRKAHTRPFSERDP